MHLRVYHVKFVRERLPAISVALNSFSSTTHADYNQMRATGNKLQDKYIIPIARELAEALKAIHEAGIIHRDVKGNCGIHVTPRDVETCFLG